MNRRWVFGLGIGLVALLIGLGFWVAMANQKDQVDPNRNIILILVDTLRADHVGLYGYEARATTPNLDHFGVQGRWFANAWSTAPWTTPSVMSLMTSLYPAVHGFNLEGHRYASEVPTLSESIEPLAEVLRANGYTTMAVTGGGGVGSVYGFDRGFDRFFEPETVTGEDVERGIDLALNWLDSVDDGPFFLFLHTYEVHLPNTHDEFSDGDSPDRQAIAAYDSDLAFADRHLGRLFVGLENRSFLKDMLVVITADHGENLHDRTLGERPVEHGHHLHDELLKVPLVMVAPGLIPPDGDIPDAVQLIDVMPTILSLVGIRRQSLRLQGQDLRGRLQNWAPKIADRPIFAGAPLQGPEWHTVRFQDSKLMVTPPVNGTNWWNFLNQPSKSLYLLATDPLERVNALTSTPKTANELEEILQRQLMSDAELRQAFGPISLAPVEDTTRANLIELGYLEP